MAVPRSRVLDLLKVQCRIFSSTFNPGRTRTGNKVLRERLKGPSIAAYYPRRVATFKDLKNLYPDLETWDDDEEDRLENIGLYEVPILRFIFDFAVDPGQCQGASQVTHGPFKITDHQASTPPTRSPPSRKSSMLALVDEVQEPTFTSNSALF
ncbi:MAG: hypothetical protein LQ345_000300 [Seirophora villosa]|nr:MAG: hypothetical protein LQ345_000300 [Seirophora villosa]